MQCTKCGKTFASHTARPEICWDCYMKDINNYQVTNTPIDRKANTRNQSRHREEDAEKN